jgi:hypothetical protein
MRASTVAQIAAVAAFALAPAVTSASPLRAGASLPAQSTASAISAERASAPVAGESSLIGFPILALVGLFGGIALIVVLASGSGGGGRSPG